MIIDVHAHIAPDKINQKVLAGLEQAAGYKAKGLNTVQGLKDHMKAAGTDKSILLALALEPGQVKAANDWVMSIQDDTYISFGSIHPDDQDRVDEVRRLRENGLKGIKIHSSFHLCRPQDPRMLPVYEEAGDDMIVLFHTGRFHTDTDQVWAAPANVAKVAELFPKLKIIAGHMGGLDMLDEAKRDLYGKNVYVETSWPPGVSLLPPGEMMEIIKLHGVDKMLFGTDYAMGSQIEDLRYISGLPVSSTDKDRILGLNAMDLLGI